MGPGNMAYPQGMKLGLKGHTIIHDTSDQSCAAKQKCSKSLCCFAFSRAACDTKDDEHGWYGKYGRHGWHGHAWHGWWHDEADGEQYLRS